MRDELAAENWRSKVRTTSSAAAGKAAKSATAANGTSLFMRFLPYAKAALCGGPETHYGGTAQKVPGSGTDLALIPPGGPHGDAGARLSGSPPLFWPDPRPRAEDRGN